MLAATMDVPAVLSGTVVEVDNEARTCNIDIDGTTLPGVLLQPVLDNTTGLVIFPKVGATALCLYNAEYDGWVLLQTTEVEQVLVNIGNTAIEASADGVKFNNGKNGGLVNINTLKPAFSAVVTDIAIIATALNTLLPTPIVTTSYTLDNTTIEDTKVQH